MHIALLGFSGPAVTGLLMTLIALALICFVGQSKWFRVMTAVMLAVCGLLLMIWGSEYSQILPAAGPTTAIGVTMITMALGLMLFGRRDQARWFRVLTVMIFMVIGTVMIWSDRYAHETLRMERKSSVRLDR